MTEAVTEQANGWNPNALLFPGRAGGYLHQASMHVSILAPAYLAAGWREPGAHGHHFGDWTLHTLRHVFCTTALNDWRLDVTDVAVLAGHANTRITMERYVSATGGTFDRAFAKTRDRPRADAG